MGNDDDLYRVAESCIAMHKRLIECGSERITTVSKILMLELGRELAARSSRKQSCESKGVIPSQTQNIERLIILLEIGKNLCSSDEDCSLVLSLAEFPSNNSAKRDWHEASNRRRVIGEAKVSLVEDSLKISSDAGLRVT
jgi:hypothetical protein